MENISSAASSLERLIIEPTEGFSELEIPPVSSLGQGLLEFKKLSFLRVPVEALVQANGGPCRDPRVVLPVNLGSIEITDPTSGIVEWGELPLSGMREGMFPELHTLMIKELNALGSLGTASFQDAAVWSSLSEAGVSVQWFPLSDG
jgi:hypothetical protein